MKDKYKNIIKKLIYIFLAILVVFIAVIYFNDTDLYGPYEVTRVVDGDTIVVSINGDDTKVRLLCINAPESVHQDESKNTEEGKEASNLLKELIGDSKVYLEYDEELYDQYDRVLAYVYLEDKSTMLDIEMVKRGYAKAVVYEPNSKYYEKICYYEEQARLNKVGLWGTGFYE